MPNVEVVYLYENVARELDVACAVAALLRQRYGLAVEIVQWPQSVPSLYGKVDPRVVVLPFCYFEHSFDCLLEWRQAAFLNLSWEQIFYRGNVQAKTPRGRFALHHVIHHAWSDVYARFARELSIPDDLIVVNGQPAYALYTDPYRRYFVSREELARRHGLDPRKRWVFFPENYNWAFYSEQMLRFFRRAGQAEEDIQQMREFCRESFRQVMQWFADVTAGGQVEAIIRPRPATALGDFRAAVHEVVPHRPPHMHLIQAETVREWILASDVVLSSHSTSLIEAAVAEREAFMVTPTAVPPPLRQEWHGLVPALSSAAAFSAACLAASDPSKQARLREWARSTFMSRGDAIENVASLVARLANGQARRPPVPSRWTATAQGDWPAVPKPIWYAFRRARALYRHLVPLEPDPGLREYVSRKDIDERVGRWMDVLSPSMPAVADRRA